MNTRSHIRLNEEKGSATLTVTLIGMIATMIVFAIMQIGQRTSSYDIKNLQFYSTVELVKANLFSILDNSVAWTKTIEANQAAGRMACIYGVSCDPSTPYSGYLDETIGQPITYYGEVISLKTADNADYYDATQNTSGFKSDGTVCNTYSKDYVNTGCIMRVRVAWQPFCTAACAVPGNPVVLRVNFFTPWTLADKQTVNPRPSGFSFNYRQTDGIIPELNTYR